MNVRLLAVVALAGGLGVAEHQEITDAVASRLLLENEHVKIWEADVGPGEDFPLHRHAYDAKPIEVRMRPLVNDRWRAEFRVEKLGLYLFTIEAWIDHFLTWHRDLQKRAKSDVDVQLLIGLAMIRAAAARAKGRDRTRLEHYIGVVEGSDDVADKVHAARRLQGLTGSS